MHKEPHEYVAWFNSEYGEDRYDELRYRANKIAKFNYEEKYNELKELEGR